MIWISPPAPEPEGNDRCWESVALLSVWFAKIVSVVSMSPPA